MNNQVRTTSLCQEVSGFSYYVLGKIPVLTFVSGDAPSRPKKINGWFSQLTIYLTDRANKQLPYSPMCGLVTKLPLLWGPPSSDFGPNWADSVGIQSSLREFKEWKNEEYRYEGIEILEKMRVNGALDSFLASELNDGSPYTEDEQKHLKPRHG